MNEQEVLHKMLQSRKLTLRKAKGIVAVLASVWPEVPRCKIVIDNHPEFYGQSFSAEYRALAVGGVGTDDVVIDPVLCFQDDDHLRIDFLLGILCELLPPFFTGGDSHYKVNLFRLKNLYQLHCCK